MRWILGKLMPPNVKKLGALEPQHVIQAERFMERKQNDCMPAEFFIFAADWITNHKKLPKAPLSRLR